MHESLLMKKLNLPKFQFRIKEDQELLYIFDPSRRKYVRLTPEEWVRQNFTAFLIEYKQFPRGRIAQEISIKLNGMSRRIDTVVYDNHGSPVALIEYKSPDVKISQETFNQIVRYNMVMQVPYLIVSNGLNHYCCKIDYVQNKASYLHEIPNYNAL